MQINLIDSGGTIECLETIGQTDCGEDQTKIHFDLGENQITLITWLDDLSPNDKKVILKLAEDRKRFNLSLVLSME